MAAKVLVIGFGRERAAAEVLRRTLNNDHVEFRTCDRLMPDLIEPLGSADLVIFLAGDDGGAPGQLDPATLLDLVKVRYGACPEAVVLSPQAEPELPRRVEQHIAEAERLLRWRQIARSFGKLSAWSGHGMR